MRKAFTYMFKDKCFYKKALVYLVLSFLYMTFLALADMNSGTGSCYSCIQTFGALNITSLVYRGLGLFFVVILCGYFLSNLEAVMKQKTNPVFPFFNLKQCFIKGFKYTIAILLTFLAFYLLLLVCITICVIIPKINIISGMPVVFVSLLIFYIICYNAFIYEYISTNKILTFFNFKKAVLLIKKSPKNYFKYWGVLVSCFILGAIFVYIAELICGIFENRYLVMFISNLVSATLETYIAYLSCYLINKSIITE